MGLAVVSGRVLFGGGANIIDTRCRVRVCSALTGLPRARSGITARSLQYLSCLQVSLLAGCNGGRFLFSERKKKDERFVLWVR